ncbi:hypothetical protein [Glutamicibacter sp. TV12E]|uniref:hypothetical protein n=1 Tax=Glutamicibacter sp. TV12E TaxID=3446362 RepID=UPI00403444B7
MTSQPIPNPDALEAGAKALFLRERKYHTPTLECPEPPNWEDLTDTSQEHYRDNARAVLAAAQPVVNSVEELAALPIGSIVQDLLEGWSHRKDTPTTWLGFGDENGFLAHDILLPARVLYRPEVNDA